MRIVLGAARSAPGVTTATLAIASVWPGRVLLVEASPDGGALAARFGLTLRPGATTLAAALRRGTDPDLVWSHTQPLPGTDGRVHALVGPPAPEPARAWLATAAASLADLLTALDDDVAVVVDAGRLDPDPAASPLITSADRFLLVARPRVEELQTLAVRLPTLRQIGPAPQLLLVGDRPYRSREVAATLGCPVAGVLADDRAAADALSGDPRAGRISRSRLLRSASPLVDDLRTSGTMAEPEGSVARAPAWTASEVVDHG